MKKFVICFLLVVALSIVPLVFVGCKNDTPAKSESSSKPSSETTIETSRKFKFERQNNFENINYDFENNKITLKLSSNPEHNVILFKVSIYYMAINLLINKQFVMKYQIKMKLKKLILHLQIFI